MYRGCSDQVTLVREVLLCISRTGLKNKSTRNEVIFYNLTSVEKQEVLFLHYTYTRTQTMLTLKYYD